MKMMLPKLTLICLALLALPIATALAHPMGNFSISHYTALRVERDQLHIRYRLDIAEIPTFQELPSLDANRDEAISLAERQAYLSRKIEQLTRGQTLRLNGHPTAMSVVSSQLQVRPGAGDLPTLLITIDYQAPLRRLQDRNQVEYADNNFAQRAGWREIVAVGSNDRPLIDSSVPAQDRSDKLTAYPIDAVAAPPQDRRARFTVSNQQSAVERSAHVGLDNRKSEIGNRKSGDRFTELITAKELSIGVLMFSLLVAFGLGAVHAMSPGHGKTVVAAYLVGSRGTAEHAVLLGAVVTFTHTAGVFALGFVALFATGYILPEQLYPWLGFASGMTIVGIGVWQFVKRYAHLQRHGQPHDHHHNHHHHGSADDHHHGHWRHGHSHHIDKITPRSLIALGISGGLVPCPSALVVLLGAITLNRIGFGLILILAFSLGLASVLIGIGLLMLYARRLVERFRWQGGLIRRLPLFSSLVVAVLGLPIALQALVSGGIVQLTISPLDLGATGMLLNMPSFDVEANGMLLTTMMSSWGSLGVGADAALLTALGLGFVLGLKHALDPDHIVAVSTIVSEHQSLARSTLIGTFWGIGHTTTLSLVGLLVIGLRLTIPQSVALSLEFGVALMLIVLGVNVLRKTVRLDLHAHPHSHWHGDGTESHTHLHIHAPGGHHHHQQEHDLLKYAKRPLLVGMVHGLAGSAALMLLVLATISSPLLGLIYIVVFGIGSIGGMLIVSSVIGLPFVWTARRFGRLNRGIKLLAGVSSVAFGLFLAWQIGVAQGLLF